MMAAGGLIGIPMELFRAQGVGEFAEVTVLNMALLPVWGQMFIFPLNIPAWTIFAQVVCEGGHAFGLWRLRRWCLPVLTLVLGASLVRIGISHGSFDVGARPETLVGGIVRCLFAYTIGMGLARWWRDQPPVPVPRRSR